MERKLSDVVLALESSVEEIKSYVKSLDYNIKLLLNEKNVKTSQPSQNIEEILKKAVQPTVEPSELVDFPQVINVLPNGTPRTVQEKLFYKSDPNKLILLAQIEIFDESGQKLVKKTRTNNQGAWTARLAPGTYQIRAAKGATIDKAGVVANYTILVPAGEGSLTLESRQI